jgi:lipopolysaccharide export system protein LptC
MTSLLNRLAVVAVLMALAALSWWLPNRVTDRTTLFDGERRHEPDYIIENFTATAMDPQGHRRHELSAVKLSHYPDTDTLELVRPHLVQYTPGAAPLHTVADRGMTTPDSKEILMRGNVRVTRGVHGGQPGGEIQTQEMRVLLE